MPEGCISGQSPRQELRKYPTGAPACVQPAKKGERGMK